MLKYNWRTRACGFFLLFATAAIALPTQTVKTIYSFCSQSGCPDGDGANAGLVQATNGNFYGTMAGGGASGYGTVFKITPSGKVTTLHSFNQTDGANPFAGLIQPRTEISTGQLQEEEPIFLAQCSRLRPAEL